jgi:hypothetical protein
MSIIYSYPTKASPVDNDLLIISDSADENKTKQITVSAIKGLTAGVTSIIAGNNITIDPLNGVGDVTINAVSGDMQSVFNASTPNVSGIDKSKTLILQASDITLTADNDDPNAPATATGDLMLVSKSDIGGHHNSPTRLRLRGGQFGQGELGLLGIAAQDPLTSPAVGDILVVDSLNPPGAPPYGTEAVFKLAKPSSLTVEDEDTQYSLNPVKTINFKGGGISVGNGADANTVDVEVLPRLNQGWSPLSISQGTTPVTITAGTSKAFAVQAICDVAAGQLTVTRIFGNLPRGCRVNVAVYTGTLTFQGSTELVYFGRLRNQDGDPGVSSTNTDDNSFINNIFYIESDANKNNWVPVAGTPIITIIEIDNFDGVDGSNNPKDAIVLGISNGNLPNVPFGTNLNFQVPPPQNPPGTTSVFTDVNTALGKRVNTILNFGSANPSLFTLCQHFDPDKKDPT